MENQLDLLKHISPRPHGARKYLKPALALAFLVGSVFCSNAWGDRSGHHHGYSRVHVGVAIGAPLYWGGGWYGDPYFDYPYAYRYRPALVVVEAPVYVERGVTPAAGLWYFCSNPQGYYPYVKQCSTPWRTVAPYSVTP
ncbi:hypothetical protein ACFDR9_001252 [Janthinobacterium sp. CG_23.3]|uniref:hypothetical protein n=1 Tax=Janthinobacterium sp. CG_23.3 TaxID=3349634 RepID=UPI0038D3696E